MDHSFSKSLAFSHRHADLPIWEEMYRKAFPDFAAMVDHRQNGPHQRAGIDRSIILANSKQILVDEKVRGRNKKTGRVYEDIALEYWSKRDRRDPGWVCKSLLCDYIAYAIAPLGRGYLLPVPQLQSAWKRYGEEWKARYPEVLSSNLENGIRWTTVSVGVPVKELFSKIGEALRVSFEAMELVENGDCGKEAALPINESTKPSQPTLFQ